MPDTPRQEDAARFEADPLEATRGREQGLGVGERELKAQRDPERSFQPTNEDIAEEMLEEDEAVQAGSDRSNRAETAARDVDQGRKTVERQRAIIRGELNKE